MTTLTLEPEAQKVADLTAKPPFLYELGPEDARKALDDIQAEPIDMPKVEEEWLTVAQHVEDWVPSESHLSPTVYRYHLPD